MVGMPEMDREQRIHIQNVLTSAGLEGKEIEVYLELLTAKSAAVSVISRNTKLPRATLYFILDGLCEKGFASRVDKGKVRHYIAESPERITTHLQERQRMLRNTEQQLQSVLPLLHSLTSETSKRPNVTLLHGIEGSKQTYKEILPYEFIGFLNPTVMYEAFGKRTHEILFNNELKLRGRDLLTDGPYTARLMEECPINDSYQYRILPKDVTFGCDVMAWDDKVAFFSYDKQHTIVHIQSQEIADLIRSWFEMMWKFSHDPQ